MAEKLTKEEFVKTFCKKTKMSQEELLDAGLVAAPCDCGEKRCNGWQMLFADEVDQPGGDE